MKLTCIKFSWYSMTLSELWMVSENGTVTVCREKGEEHEIEQKGE